MSETIDLGGQWTGVYFYPVESRFNPLDDRAPTSFLAELTDAGGIVAGTTLEEDTFDANSSMPLKASVQGSHDGVRLTFVKVTEAKQGFVKPIHYEGEVSADGNTIKGRWFVPGCSSGTFRMQRRTGREAAQDFAWAEPWTLDRRQSAT